MNSSLLADRVREAIARQIEVPPLCVKDYERFEADYGLDSLALIELEMAIEDAFEIDIPDEVGDKIVTVGDAILAVGELLRKKGVAIEQVNETSVPENSVPLALPVAKSTEEDALFAFIRSSIEANMDIQKIKSAMELALKTY